MFHVEPTVHVLVLGAFLSFAALAQTDAGQGASDAVTVRDQGPGAGSVAPAPQSAKKKPRTSKATTTTGASASKKSSKTAAATGKRGAGTKAPKRDPRTAGIGRTCSKRADCASSAHVCLRQRDQRGKTLPRGVCVLPCAGLEQGLTKTRPGFPARDPQTTKRILKVPPPPRCPANYQCRSKGGDVPIDMCVKG